MRSLHSTSKYTTALYFAQLSFESYPRLCYHNLKMEISILIDQEFKTLIKTDWLKKAAQAALGREGVSESAELGIVLTGQDKIRELNSKYRGKDEPTDVLAFSTEEGADLAQFILPPDGIRHLGEVIISYPQAASQASERHHSIEREIAILLIHGVLHLLGYQHDQPEPEREMKAKETEILSQIKAGGNETV